MYKIVSFFILLSSIVLGSDHWICNLHINGNPTCTSVEVVAKSKELAIKKARDQYINELSYSSARDIRCDKTEKKALFK